MFRNKYLKISSLSAIGMFLVIAISIPFANIATAAEKEGQFAVDIKDMRCEMCKKAVENLLMKCSGKEGCRIAIKDDKAIVTIEAGKDKEHVLGYINKNIHPYTLMPREGEEQAVVKGEKDVFPYTFMPRISKEHEHALGLGEEDVFPYTQTPQ